MNCNRLSQKSSNERGSAVLEFGLAFLLLFSVICAIMEFSWVVTTYNILAGATREGARYAMVHGSASGSAATQSDIQNVIRQWAVGLDASSIVVTATWSPGNGAGGRVHVQSRYSVAPLTGLVLGTVTIGSSSEMVISQ
jgi:Flp pilus assembly protein TadG